MGIDAKRIYQGEGRFNHSLPEQDFNKFLHGTGFPGGSVYTEDEQHRVFQDIVRLTDKAFGVARLDPRFKSVFMTGGAPGSGKNLLIDQILERNGLTGRVAVIDPDTMLKQMKLTYVDEMEAELAKVDQQDAEARYAIKLRYYTKYRSASFACSEWIIANLLLEKLSFCITMTQTSPFSKILFKFIKSQGYTIEIVHLTAPDSVRHESIEIRNLEFVQVTDQDISIKGKLFPPRLKDTFKPYADKLQFYYREKASADARLAAKWEKTPKNEDVKGASNETQLRVIDKQVYSQIKLVHNQTCHTIGKEDLTKQGIQNVEEILWEAVIPDSVST